MKFKKTLFFFQKSIDKLKKGAIIPRHTCETNRHKKQLKIKKQKKVKKSVDLVKHV